MNLEDQLRRYFGTTEIACLSADAIAAGSEHMLVDLGLERDAGRRFALWALMHMLGTAPDIDIAFPDEREREAARDFMDLADKAAQADEAEERDGV